ncbi:MAG: hypothetical protein J6X93_04365 [Bacilli bacterium]|nr:hypothetical protein [Bacilli bacterium]
MFMCDFSISLDIGTAIIALLGVVSIIVYFCSRKKLKKLDFDVDACELGLTGGNIHLICNNTHKQIAYRIWVDINTRVLAVKVNLDEDNIRAVNDSYYKCFTDTRELLKEIPANKLNDENELVNLIIRFLNEVMRPYLTKWGVRYANWFDNEISKDENKGLNPIDIQRKYPLYNELTEDLLLINEKVINYSNKLQEIAFSISKNKKVEGKGKND